MNSDRPKFTAIGITFSFETLQLLSGILDDPKFGFGGEGTMASGYELYVESVTASDAIRMINENPQLEGHQVELYERMRSSDDGTRYDRLIDHIQGEDPDRPSVNGISIEL